MLWRYALLVPKHKNLEFIFQNFYAGKLSRDSIGFVYSAREASLLGTYPGMLIEPPRGLVGFLRYA